MKDYRFVLLVLTSLVLVACGEEEVDIDLGTLNVAGEHKGDDGQPLLTRTITIEPNVEQRVTFESDLYGMIISITSQGQSALVGWRLENSSYGFEPYVAEPAVEHRADIAPYRMQSRIPKRYEIVLHHDQQSAVEVKLQIEYRLFDPCEQAMRFSPPAEDLRPMAWCSVIAQSDQNARFTVEEPDICVSRGVYTVTSFDYNEGDEFFDINGPLNFVPADGGQRWYNRYSWHYKLPSRYSNGTEVTEDETTITLNSPDGAGYLDGNPALIREKAIFHKDRLTLEYTQDIRPDRLLSRWRTNYAYTLDCAPYQWDAEVSDENLEE